MEIKGHFSEFPFPEILQFIERRKATGCLSLNIYSNHYAELYPQPYTIWFEQGQIIAAQRINYSKDIYDLAVQHEWVSHFVAKRLKERSPQDMAAGVYLESQGILTTEQRRSLFFTEVVHRVESLCNIHSATFEFKTILELPVNEMTGFKVSPGKVAEYGLQGRCETRKTSNSAMVSLAC